MGVPIGGRALGADGRGLLARKRALRGSVAAKESGLERHRPRPLEAVHVPSIVRPSDATGIEGRSHFWVV